MTRPCIAHCVVGQAPVHAAPDCDGTCHEGVVTLDGAAGVAVVILVAGMSPEDAQPFLVLTLVAELAGDRARALALLRVWLAARARLRTLGTLRFLRAPYYLPPAFGELLALCCVGARSPTAGVAAPVHLALVPAPEALVSP